MARKVNYTKAEISHNYYMRNKEYYLEYQKKWRKENPENMELLK